MACVLQLLTLPGTPPRLSRENHEVIAPTANLLNELLEVLFYLGDDSIKKPSQTSAITALAGMSLSISTSLSSLSQIFLAAHWLIIAVVLSRASMALAICTEPSVSHIVGFLRRSHQRDNRLRDHTYTTGLLDKAAQAQPQGLAVASPVSLLAV